MVLGIFKFLWAIPIARKIAMALGVVLAIWGAVQVGEWKGAREAKAECKMADLLAENAELKRQASARNALLKMAREDQEVERAAAEEADEKVREYENLLESGGDTPLTDDDVKRMQPLAR